MACHPRLSLKQYFIDYNLSKFKNHKDVLLFCLNIKQIKATKNTFIASFKNYNFFLENRIYASIATPGLNFKTIICRRLYLSGNFLCDCSCKQLSMLPSFMFCPCLYPRMSHRKCSKTNSKFKIRQSTIKYAGSRANGTNDSSTKRLMCQVLSMLPSFMFCPCLYPRMSHSKCSKTDSKFNSKKLGPN